LKDREDSGEFIDNILDNYNVDPGRVYLTGPRLGGYGTWNMAMMYPEYFAAIAPMC
jgi:predicted peptidase